VWGQVLYLLLGTKVQDTLLYLRYMTIIIVLDGARVLAHESMTRGRQGLTSSVPLTRYYSTYYLLRTYYLSTTAKCSTSAVPLHRHAPCPMMLDGSKDASPC